MRWSRRNPDLYQYPIRRLMRRSCKEPEAVFCSFQKPWNLAAVSVALLPNRLRNSVAMWTSSQSIPQCDSLWNFAINLFVIWFDIEMSIRRLYGTRTSPPDMVKSFPRITACMSGPPSQFHGNCMSHVSVWMFCVFRVRCTVRVRVMHIQEHDSLHRELTVGQWNETGLFT